MRQSFFTLLIILFLCSSSWAANCETNPTTYYVDFSVADDTGAGTSTGTAWKHCPGDSGGAWHDTQCTLQAGDTVIFKGGVEYAGSIAITWTGTEGSPITYDGNSAGTWGTGRAIIDGDDTVRDKGFYQDADARNYITIKNFELRNMKISNSGMAINFWGSGSYTSTGVIVQDNYVHDIGYWNNDGSVYPDGTGIGFSNPVSCLITGNTITKTGGAGVRFQGGTDSTISNNTIHSYIIWGIDISSPNSSAYARRHIIKNNTIYDLYYYDAGFYGGAGGPHTDSVFIRGDYTGNGGIHEPYVPDSIIIDGNLFYNNYTFTNAGGTAFIYLSETKNTTVRNNVFINPHNIAVSAEYSVGNMFYNNTFYTPGSVGLQLHVLEAHVMGSGSDVRNNIFYSSSMYAMQFTTADAKAVLTQNNNYYVDGTLANLIDFPGVNTSLTSWQSQGFDTSPGGSGNGAATLAAIKFVSTTGYPTACQTMDLTLQTDSPAKDTGASIAGWATPTDKNGVSRPQGVAWDIGAYEYGGGGPAVGGITLGTGGTVTLGSGGTMVLQ